MKPSLEHLNKFRNKSVRRKLSNSDIIFNLAMALLFFGSMGFCLWIAIKAAERI